MPGALNQLVGNHQPIPAIGTLNINLRALVFEPTVWEPLTSLLVTWDRGWEFPIA